MEKIYEPFGPDNGDNIASLAAAQRLTSLNGSGRRALQTIGETFFPYNVAELGKAYPAKSVEREGARDYFEMVMAAMRGNKNAQQAYDATTQAFRLNNTNLVRSLRIAAGAMSLTSDVSEPTSDEADAFGHLMDGSGLTLMAQFGDRDVPQPEHRSAITTAATHLTLARIGIALPTMPVYGITLS